MEVPEKYAYLCGVVQRCSTTTPHIQRTNAMKKQLVTILAILCLGTLTSGAQILWKISGNGLQKPSYLLGTHHLAPVEMLDTLTGFNEALAAVDRVYGEMEMSESATPQAQQIMMAAATAPADSTLSVLLSPTQADSLNALLTSSLGPMYNTAALNGVKPAMVSTLIALAQNRTAFPDFNPSRQLDTEIQTRAISMGKEVAGLETITDQCNAMFGSPLTQQTDELMSTVRNSDKAISMVKKLADAYIKGDLMAMLAIIDDPETGISGESADRLINDRNIRWSHILAGILPTMTIMIAVGAGHLPGDKGLINLLRKDGYNVEPVSKQS